MLIKDTNLDLEQLYLYNEFKMNFIFHHIECDFYNKEYNSYMFKL